MKGLSRREKGVMDKDNSVVIAGRRDYRGLNGNGRNTIKIKFLKCLHNNKNSVYTHIHKTIVLLICLKSLFRETTNCLMLFLYYLMFDI